jgi:hypothetical protein
VVVARLRDRSPQALPPARQSPAPSWAPKLAGYVPPDPKTPRSRNGTRTGRMTVTHGPSRRKGYERRVTVTYESFSDVRGITLDGTESSDYTIDEGPYGGPGFYNSDITVTGRRRGYLRARNVRLQAGTIGGTIRSRLGSRTLTLGPIP